MDDAKGLDLSLGLPCGGNSLAPKVIRASSSEIRSVEDDRGSKLINEFKNFLEGGNHHSVKVGENFYNQYAKSASDIEASKKLNTGAIWLTSECRSTEVEDGSRSGVGEKRKNLFTETEHKKKHEIETNCVDLVDKTKVSHISITTDDGSTAENEDTADSEVDGSTSRHMLSNDDVSKKYVTSGSIYRSQKDGFGDSESIEILGQKRHSVSSEKEFNMSTLPVSYGVPFPTQPINMNASYSQSVKDYKSIPCLPKYPFTSIIPVTGAPNVERPNIPPVFPANFPLMFGYSSVQLPVLDRDNSRGIIPHNQQIDPSFPGAWNPVNHSTQATVPVVSNKSPEPTQYDSRALEHGKSSGKQHVGEEGCSSLHIKADVKDPSDESGAEAMPSEYPAIRPGIAADLKFGGCGSNPNLPWVSTTGPGPNGRAISGVTYRFSPSKIKIVCACHGSHMSPDEFVRHASEEHIASPDAGLASPPSSNPAAFARS